MHEDLVRFSAVAGLVESRPSDVELQGVLPIAVAAVSKDQLNDELLERSARQAWYRDPGGG